MWESDWRSGSGFERRVAEVRSGLQNPSPDSTGITLGGGSDRILPVALKRVQKTDLDLTEHVLAAKEVLETTFHGEDFAVKVEADLQRHSIPEHLRGQPFKPREAIPYFGTDYAVLGMITDARLGKNLKGYGSSEGWFAVTANSFSSLEEFGKVVIHEFGHSLGLSHCPDPSCLMAENKNRRKSVGGFCRKCSRALRRKARERAKVRRRR